MLFLWVCVCVWVIPVCLPPPTCHDGRFRLENGWLTFKEKAAPLRAQRTTIIILHQRRTMRVVSQCWVCTLIVRSWQKHFLMMLTHSKHSDLVECLFGHCGINLVSRKLVARGWDACTFRISPVCVRQCLLNPPFVSVQKLSWKCTAKLLRSPF